MPMSGEEMIKDFVNRVRQENTNAANSIVPAGTPMQQPQQPPQPQPAQASGIAGYSSGGVRGFQDAGAFISSEDKVPRLTRDQKFGWHPDQEPLSAALGGIRNPNGGPSLPESKYYPPSGMNPKLGMPRTLNPQKPSATASSYNGPRYPYQGYFNSLLFGPQQRDLTGTTTDKAFEQFFSRKKEYADDMIAYDGLNMNSPSDPTAAGGGSAGIAALMADAPRLGAFTPSKFIAPPKYEDAKLIDLNEAGEERVNKNRDKIDALAAPYNEGAAELEGMSEEIKRKEIFNGMVKAGIAMMQGGGASFDPRSGDMMAIMGDGASAYVESLTKDRKRQQELKEKIVAYKGAANELTFNAEGQMFAQGADIAQARNQQAITEGAYKNQYNSRIAEMENSFNVGQDANRLRLIIAQAEIDTAKFKASLEAQLKASPGIDPELALKISAEAGKRADARFATMMGKFEMDPDNPKAYAKRLEAAHAAARAAYSEAISSFLDFSAGRFDYDGGIATLSERAAERQTPGVPNVEEMEGDPPTSAITGYPYSKPRNGQKDEDVVDFDPRVL
jgi:hypothetical protein